MRAYEGLCIGGPLNGKRAGPHLTPSFNCAEPPKPFPIGRYDDPIDEKFDVTRHRYEWSEKRRAWRYVS